MNQNSTQTPTKTEQIKSDALNFYRSEYLKCIKRLEFNREWFQVIVNCIKIKKPVAPHLRSRTKFQIEQIDELLSSEAKFHKEILNKLFSEGEVNGN